MSHLPSYRSQKFFKSFFIYYNTRRHRSISLNYTTVQVWNYDILQYNQYNTSILLFTERKAKNPEMSHLPSYRSQKFFKFFFIYYNTRRQHTSFLSTIQRCNYLTIISFNTINIIYLYFYSPREKPEMSHLPSYRSQKFFKSFFIYYNTRRHRSISLNYTTVQVWNYDILQYNQYNTSILLFTERKAKNPEMSHLPRYRSQKKKG